MIRKLFLCLLLAGVLISGGAMRLQALPFTDTINFGDVTIWGGDFLFIDPPPFSYTHSLNMIPAGATLNSASLSITHKGNVSEWYNPEIWLVGAENVDLGQLSKSTNWTTDTFNLSSILSKITDTTPWSLQVKLSDETCLLDTLCLRQSTLCGDYTPVPEPGSMLLLGSGLIGLVGAGFRKKMTV